MGMPSRDYFLEESNLRYLESYRIFMITISTLLGAPILDATEDADRIIEFEVHLAKVTPYALLSFIIFVLGQLHKSWKL